jgi:hypothetical protein
MGARPHATAGAGPVPASRRRGGRDTPASGLLRRCPLDPRRLAPTGAQGHRTRDQAADGSTATAQDQLRSLLWADLIAYLQAERHG